MLHEAGALDQARVTSIQSAPIGQLGFSGRSATADQLRQAGAGRTEIAGGEVLCYTTQKRARWRTRWGSTSARSASIASSPLTARSVRLGVISAKSRWTAGIATAV